MKKVECAATISAASVSSRAFDAEILGTVASTEEFLRNYMVEFHAHIERVLTVLPRED